MKNVTPSRRRIKTNVEARPRLVWVVRIAYLLVFLVNVQCALSFAIAPAEFAGAYELDGVAGEAAVRGMGIVFLMWNATYPAFIARPSQFGVLGWVILAQQAIGLVGETALLLFLPTGHDQLAASVLKFIVFDAAGLIVMTVTYLLYMMVNYRHGKEAG